MNPLRAKGSHPDPGSRTRPIPPGFTAPPPQLPVWGTRIRHGVLLGLLSLWLQGALGAPGAAPGREPIAFRFALTQSTLGDIGHHDAAAAIKVWVRSMVEGFPLPVEVEVAVLAGAGEVREAVVSGRLDGSTVSAQEFLDLGLSPAHFYVIRRSGTHAVRYLLLRRRDTGMTVRDVLEKGTIAMPRTAVNCLGSAWIEGVRRDRAPDLTLRSDQFLEVPNASKAILRVFFKQASACLATEEAFRVACEMNPQIGVALEALETSPEIIPSAFFLRDGVRADLRAAIEERFFAESAPVNLKQVLTVFQGDRILRLPLAEWQPTLDLVRHWSGRSPRADSAPRVPGRSVASSPPAAAAPLRDSRR